MEQENAYKYLITAIEKKHKHRDYKRVTELASKYHKLITGEKIDELMKQFNQRETEDQFKQRKTITKDVSRSICNNLMDVANKVPRSPGMRRVLNYTKDEKEGKLGELNRMLTMFYGNETLDEYLASRFIHLNYTDPNAFMIIEFKPFDGLNEKPQPYPFEVSSKAAVDYRYVNNVLKYLLVESTIKVTNKQNKKEEALKYTFYLPDRTIVFQQLPRDFTVPAGQEKTVIEIEAGKYVVIGKAKYVIIEPLPHDIGYVPAKRIGYKDDLVTDGRTFVNPFDAAVPYIEKVIKANSEMDLTMALHAFPQKIQYLQACQVEGCNKGYKPDGKKCEACDGTGLSTIKSAQEMINLQLPRDKDDLFDLDNIIRYIYPPIDLLKFQDEYIEKLIKRCRQVVFNSDIFSRQEIAETATGKNIDLQNVYDTLYPFAINFSKTWRKIVTTIAKIGTVDEGLEAAMTFDKDFKFKTINELFTDREKAERSGASTAIKREIENDIMGIKLADRPEQYNRYITMQDLNPFANKSREEIIVLLNSVLTTKLNKVLYLHLETIIKELEEKHKDLYKMNKTAFAELVKEKARAILAEIEAETPEIDLLKRT